MFVFVSFYLFISILIGREESREGENKVRERKRERERERRRGAREREGEQAENKKTKGAETPEKIKERESFLFPMQNQNRQLPHPIFNHLSRERERREEG